jgi:hypothetical protein
MRRRGHNELRLAVQLTVALLLALTCAARRSRAQLAEERIPPADLPASPNVTAPPASNATAAGAGASADWQGLEGNGGSSAAGATPPAPPVNETSPGAAATFSTDETMATPAALPSEPPPALDLSATQVGPDLSSASLEPEIKAATPARAASLRLTEQARRELQQADTSGALEDLSRAVSIDPGNAFEYYYLGRVYLTRHDYTQAETFFSRAELGFVGRPDWLAETLSFEGATDEQLGRIPEAVKAYQRAVALAPGNVRAQVGLGRLAPSVGAVTGLDQSATTDQDLAPPAASAPPPAPDEPVAAPPPTDLSN